MNDQIVGINDEEVAERLHRVPLDTGTPPPGLADAVSAAIIRADRTRHQRWAGAVVLGVVIGVFCARSRCRCASAKA